MQTFLPYRSFSKSARVLDMKRLGKQRVEAYQILQCLFGKKDGWKNHPAVKMWKGYEMTLMHYTTAICKEWKSRGYKDTVEDKVTDLCFEYFSDRPASSLNKLPHWLGNPKFHLSHQSNLLRKKPEYYKQFNWEVRDDMPYIWPV